MTEITLPHNFTPRHYQLPFLKALDSGIKRVVIVWARRSGKDLCTLNWCIKKLMTEVATCFYVMPTYSQGKKVIWDSVNNDGFRFLDYFPKEIIANKNNQEMKIRLINGSLFQVIGSDNIDSLMGTNPKIVVFSEYALQDPAAWEYIRPILKVNGGVAIFISTPRGRNHFYDLFRTAQITEGWFSQKLTVEDTGVLSKEDVEKEMAEGMSFELAQQEYYCSFERGVEGSYYSQLLTKMREEERICAFLPDPYKLTHVAFDLGWDDSTALVFFQMDGSGNVRIIDYEEHSTKTLAWYKELLMKKGYKYGTYLFPHDVEHVDGLGSGCTRRDILEDLQIPVTTIPRGLVADGIEAVKALMSSRLYINEAKCGNLIKSLESYHREWDDKHKVYAQKPRHDASSHCADAVRYLASGLHLVTGASGSIESDYAALRKFWGG